MVNARLLKWKIKRLNMSNTISNHDGRILLADNGTFRIQVSDDHRMAIASLTASIGEKEHFNALGIQIELEGFLGLEGVEESPESKKEAHMRCYDVMFPYADQIVRFLAMNSAMVGIGLRKSKMDQSSIQFEPKEGTDEVIEFPEDGCEYWF